MITKCYSSNGKCPCLECEKNCCEESTDRISLTDTEKLCEAAREHCERCAMKAGENRWVD